MQILLRVIFCVSIFQVAYVGAQAVPLAALSFPGAVGWAAHTPGGRGGQLIHVSNLNAQGTGSFKSAIETRAPRVKGRTIDEWRAATSHDVTFSYNLAAEGLADASHPNGEHSKGSLVHDNVTNIIFYRNIWAHNAERSPLFKGGVRGSVINNLIYNPRTRALHYNLMALEWGDRPYQNGQLSAVGNVMRGG